MIRFRLSRLNVWFIVLNVLLTYHLGCSTALPRCSQSPEKGGQNDDHAHRDDDEGGRVEVLEFVDDVHTKADNNQAEQLSKWGEVDD